MIEGVMHVSIGVDFDGVVHAYSRGYQDGSIYDGPVDGAVEALRRLLKLEPTFIFTARDNLDDVVRWLVEHNIPAQADTGLSPLPFWDRYGVLLVTNRKLPARWYIDDRAIRFESWEQTLGELLNAPFAGQQAH